MQVQAFFHIWCLKWKSKSASTKVYDVYDPNKRYQVALCQKGSGWWFQPIHTIQFSTSQAWCRITKPSEPEAETATRNLDHTLSRVSSGRTSHFHAERPLGTAIFPLGHCCLNGLQKAMGLLHLATHSYLYIVCCIQKKTEQNLLQSAPTIFHTAATLPFEYQPWCGPIQTSLSQRDRAVSKSLWQLEAGAWSALSARQNSNMKA